MTTNYPNDFIDTIRYKAALGWADEHQALLQEIDNLTEMLCRILSEGIVPLGGGLWLDDKCDQDIVEWWEKHKLLDKNK